MSGSVDDVDLCTVVHYRGVLCEDSDTALALDVAGVHNSLGNSLILAENAALFEHFVNEGGLTVVNVRDNGDVS